MTAIQPGLAHLARCYADHDRERPCPCHHDPVWRPSQDRCDHGFTDPKPGATTPGVHGATYIPGSQSPNAEAKCETCDKHARQLREARA